MYPGKWAKTDPDRPAQIMASTGETLTYKELDERSNRLAQLLYAAGLRPQDHIAIFMENNPRYQECCWAAERSGLYFTLINSYLTAEEVAYIVDDCQPQVLITSAAKRDVALEVAEQVPKAHTFLRVDAPGGAADGPYQPFEAAVAQHPAEPLGEERLGAAMLYSSGTTGRPKGILRPLPDMKPGDSLPLISGLATIWRLREGMVYLNPAPPYPPAPHASVMLTQRLGGTAIVMERFDPAHFLQLVERYKVTHSQMVPTMFSRLLKLPEEERKAHDLSSLEVIIHAAAPCPPEVKRQMIEWWGPIIIEYYAATEGNGLTFVDSDDWMRHPGTVGKALLGELMILDDEGKELPPGEIGTVWFKGATNFTYWNDPKKTAESRDATGTASTVGDVGYVDDEGYLFLTDRKAYMNISGGVNIYPQEAENLLVTHPKVLDVAVFGVPNDEMGEEVKAVVQLADNVEPGPEVERELMAFCREHLAPYKCPRSIDFEPELPRLPTGKLYKRLLRDRYWGDTNSRILR